MFNFWAAIMQKLLFDIELVHVRHYWYILSCFVACF